MNGGMSEKLDGCSELEGFCAECCSLLSALLSIQLPFSSCCKGLQLIEPSLITFMLYALVSWTNKNKQSCVDCLKRGDKGSSRMVPWFPL